MVSTVRTRRHRELAALLQRARGIGASSPLRKMLLILNPASGGGSGPHIVSKFVLPILEQGNVKAEVKLTEYEGHAAEMVEKLDFDVLDGLLIAGGDGLVHEVTTVLLQKQVELPVAVIPVGTANALACNVYGSDGTWDRKMLAARAALAAVHGTSRRVDALKLRFKEKDHYALSLVAWGFAGAVVERAQRLRFLPWNRSYRYDLAGFLTLGNGWPALGHGLLKFPTDDTNATWFEREVNVINFMASNLPSLGQGRPVSSDLELDDGKISVNMVHAGTTRRAAVSMLRGMKKGRALEDNRYVESLRLTEFKITPLPDSFSPFCVDGDPFKAEEVHVKVLNKALTVFALPETVKQVKSSRV